MSMMPLHPCLPKSPLLTLAHAHPSFRLQPQLKQVEVEKILWALWGGGGRGEGAGEGCRTKKEVEPDDAGCHGAQKNTDASGCQAMILTQPKGGCLEVAAKL